LLGVGPGEIIALFVIALLIFGPKRLPELGKSIGQAINNFKRSTQLTPQEQQTDNTAIEQTQQKQEEDHNKSL